MIQDQFLSYIPTFMLCSLLYTLLLEDSVGCGTMPVAVGWPGHFFSYWGSLRLVLIFLDTEELPHCITQGGTVHVDWQDLVTDWMVHGWGLSVGERLKWWCPGLWLRSLSHCVVMWERSQVRFEAHRMSSGDDVSSIIQHTTGMGKCLHSAMSTCVGTWGTSIRKTDKLSVPS